MKVLRDKDNLYVRVESLYPSKHPEDMDKLAPDGNIFTQDYVELGLSPPGGGAKVYRLAANPVEGSRYDSVLAPGKPEDAQWNGRWEYGCRTSGIKGRYSLPGRTCTAWFKIPFADFQAKAPAARDVWGFNARRNRGARSLVWSDAKGATDPEALGKLAF